MNGKARGTERTNETVQKSQTRQPDQKPASLAPLQADMLSLQRAVEDPSAASPRDILTLQRLYGNRAVTRLIQAKLTVGPAGDRYEREADSVADRVMTMRLPSAGRVQRQEDEEEIQTRPLGMSITPLVQRQEDEEEIQTRPLLQRQEDEEEIQTRPLLQRQEDEEEIQTRPADGGGFQASESLEHRLGASRGGGSPLPGEVRAFMEPRFGADFGGVRVHTDSAAVQMNREISAQAFTHGQDIYMGEGRYNPGSDAGKHLLAHELTHVVQQGGAVRMKRSPEQVQVHGSLPGDRISAKMKYLDFVKMKRKQVLYRKIIFGKLMPSKDEGDTYGHWWTEVGELDGGNWEPDESYGWWPQGGVSGLGQTFKGVSGSLNNGGGTHDPHEGDAADSEFYPAMEVGDREDYDAVHDRVVQAIRTFANGYKGKWAWRFGWGQNCHTFQEKLMKTVGLKKAKATEWLKSATPNVERRLKKLLGDALFSILISGADFMTIGIGDNTARGKLESLGDPDKAALAGLMKITVEELNQGITEM